MKAVVYTKYGLPEVLHLRELKRPAPKDSEVLVKIYATSVNSWDWDLLTGKPYLYRLLFGLLKPKYNILGCDIAGRIEAVGKNVSKFKAGDEVFGDISGLWGGFAEYVCTPEDKLFLKPSFMNYEEAAAIPQAAVLALQSLTDIRPVKEGDKILINGAGGGVGTFAVQMAKSFGAHVTAVDKTGKLELLRSIGADYVIDCTKEDFTKNGQQYNLIIDVVSNRSVFEYKKSLLPEGILTMVGGTIPSLLQTGLGGPLMTRKGKKHFGLLVHKQNKNLNLINELIETGKVKPIIDKCFPLSQTPEALRYLGEGRVKGKVVVRVVDEE